MTRDTQNLQRIRRIAERLGPLVERVVFLGGAVTEFLVTDPGAPLPRATLDVDVIIELASKGALFAMQSDLRDRGFTEDTSDGAPICRWLCDGIQLDVMPTDEHLLGFSNRWYPLAICHAVPFELPDSVTIRLVTAPCFLATKLEAFRGRGNGDFVASHDLEDVIAVIDGRSSLVKEIDECDARIREYLATETARLRENPAFLDAVAGHLPSDVASQARLPIVLERLRRIAAARAT